MLATRRVLIVEDEGSLAGLVAQAFENEGYKVATASNGIECMNRLTAFRPDVIVMDIMMPRLDGIDTTRLIRRHGDFRETLIVALSAKQDERTQAAMLQAGADVFLTKPFSVRALIGTVNAHLAQQS
ncbi:MAG TPA: response regulator [Candidatus Krumholzibacteria bacterium]|nr:response regulator [Candidatus Krumholzibacteria bacterium]HRX50867.1 response regulator [Candidatus Krumholzibacteria bacterium]